MKAIVCERPGELSEQVWPKPEADAETAVVKVQRVGICGTDFHIYGGQHPYLEYPRILGHELSGTVEVPAQGGSLSAGDSVIVNPYLPCGHCVACRQDKPNCCSNITVLGVHGHGGMCEYLAVPETALYSARDLTADQGAMVEFLAVGMHAVRRGKVKKGQRVLVVGIGPIGLGTALLARLEGAEVTVLDINEARLRKVAALFALDRAVHLTSRVHDELSALTGDDFFDVVIDATGNAKSMEAGFEFVAHGGTYVLVSVVKDTISFADPEFHKREMTLVGSRNATHDDFMSVISKIESGDIPTDKLHTHSCLLTELPQKLPVWSGNSGDMIKAIVKI